MPNNEEELKIYRPENEEVLLSDVLDRLMKTGVVISGDLTIGIGNIDLIYCGLRVVLASVDTLKEPKQDLDE